jgi:hypothetical protein
MPIVYRAIQGRPLTIAEADGNFQYIETELNSKLDAADYSAQEILDRLLTVDGAGSGLDADLLDGKTSTNLNTVNTIVSRDGSGNFSAGVITANLVGNVTGNITGNGTGTWTGNASNVSGVVAVTNGGTGATTGSAARTNLGLGDMSLQNPGSVAITGGTITNIVDLAITDGGTGASNAFGARANLGLAIGTDVQGFHPLLSAVTALSSNGFLARTGAGAITTRTLVAGTNISITNTDGVSNNPTISLADSVALSGTPTAPTPTSTDNTTKIATTAFVKTSYDTMKAYVDAEVEEAKQVVAEIGKAWVVFQGFNGTILASKNVDSIVLVGSGVYRLNIKPGTFSNGNFSAAGMASDQTKYMSFISSTANTLTIQTNALSGSALVGQDNSGPIRVVLYG